MLLLQSLDCSYSLLQALIHYIANGILIQWSYFFSFRNCVRSNPYNFYFLFLFDFASLLTIFPFVCARVCVCVSTQWLNGYHACPCRFTFIFDLEDCLIGIRDTVTFLQLKCDAINFVRLLLSGITSSTRSFALLF